MVGGVVWLMVWCGWYGVWLVWCGEGCGVVRSEICGVVKGERCGVVW